jgi:acyl-CoA reductase-like NAD-dependent aldehyde dehydrogenase
MKKVGPIVHGEELGSAGGEIFEVINPATGEVVAEETCCSEECVEQIVESSQEAYYSADWQSMLPADRGSCLLRLADLVEKHSEELIDLELLDTGKPISQLKGGEIPLTVSIIRFYAGAADKIEGRVKATSGGAFHFTTFEPYGVVAGILPWNYPLVNAAMKVAPALAAGNAIIVKPSVETPLSCIAFAQLCLKAGIPPGIVNVALGAGSTTGQSLVVHPGVKKVSFTGSTAVGQRLQQQAANQMKAVNLELGGKNAIIVFADADLEKAADATIFSAFLNAGQLCVSCSRLLVEKTIAGEFESILKAKLLKVKVGDPQEIDTLLGPVITRSQFDIALKYIEGAPAEGCEILAGGNRPDLPGPLTKGLWLEPTLLSGVKPGMKVAAEEIFGPVLSILEFQNESEAVQLSNSVVYGLSGSVWTKDGARALRMIKALHTGIIWVNCMLDGYPQIPVPPQKMSGTGVELGMEGLLTYCKLKSAIVAYDDQAPVGWNIK